MENGYSQINLSLLELQYIKMEMDDSTSVSASHFDALLKINKAIWSFKLKGLRRIATGHYTCKGWTIKKLPSGCNRWMLQSKTHNKGHVEFFKTFGCAKQALSEII
jgi:hypothetical protein|tara:strand:+ start:903 stop:1220 length:318 start_codon:yes stop_codon:yes gene_type:complete